MWELSKAWDEFINRRSIDTYSKVAVAKLCDRKTPITTADVAQRPSVAVL